MQESRGDRVQATDGDVGPFHGLSVDPDSGAILHVLLRRHPWGHGEMAIPIAKVSGFKEGVQLSITKHEVKDLTP